VVQATHLPLSVKPADQDDQQTFNLSGRSAGRSGDTQLTDPDDQQTLNLPTRPADDPTPDRQTLNLLGSMFGF
jgi:hypothetical protein